MAERSFPAKLLLFGEHVLLLGATALAVPIPAFSARWAWGEEESDADLLAFAESHHLRAILGDEATDLFQADCSRGMVLESNIPQGYGLGSSGALCAAIYERYITNKEHDSTRLKALFARMEAFFHGASSGIDPLTSYLNRPLLIQHKHEVQAIDMAEWPDGPKVFLIDSKQPRHSEVLVRWFAKEADENASFGNMLQHLYMPAHESMLKAWTAANGDRFWKDLDFFSQLQYEFCKPLIPNNLHEVWERALGSEEVRLKVCGAGGGGFILGFAQSVSSISQIIGPHPVVLPFEAQ
jgi:mevalonate kinase